MQCLECLIDIVDAYRISEQVDMARLSYQQLGPFVMTYRRSLDEPYRWSGPVPMLLDHSNVRVENPDELAPERVSRLGLVLGRARGRPV